MKSNGKIRVAVLMGGPSAEHEVSLRSGRMILKNLDKSRYEARGIKISKKAQWPVSLAKIKKNFDLAFIAMHGEYGEDGTVQRLLDKYKIPYTSSGAEASRLGMDKAASARLFEKAGLKTPKFVMFKKGIKFSFDRPVVVKPADRGSSVGISIVENFADFPKAVKKALQFSPNVMIQEYIKGREFTCGVLEVGGWLKPFLPTEIILLKSRFFDYQAKYTSGATKEITPPPHLSKPDIRRLQKMALKAHRAIGAGGFSRSDFILAEDGNFYVLEINTIPGMTETSLLPQAAKAGGINFPKLLDLIIESALRRATSH